MEAQEILRKRACEVIEGAEKALGKLNPKSYVDLLLDNMPELHGVADAKAILAEIGRG